VFESLKRHQSREGQLRAALLVFVIRRVPEPILLRLRL
jgi:hypothetical protein